MKYLYILLTFLYVNSWAQQVTVDSSYVNNINEETLKLRQNGQYLEAISLNDNLLTKLNKATNPLLFAKTLHARSRVEIDLGKYNKAILNAKKSREIYASLEMFAQAAAMDNIVGVGFYFKAQMDSTLYYYYKSYNLKKKFEKDTIQLAISIFNIGIVKGNLGEYDEALKDYHKTEELLNLTSEKAVFMSDLYVALSNLYRRRNNLMKAKLYAELALKEIKDRFEEDNPSKSFVYQSNAGVYRAMGDYKRAKPFLKKALKLRQNFYGFKHRWTVESHRSLAETHFYLNEIDSALIAINKAIKISKAENYDLDLANNYIEKIEILIYNKQYKQALDLIPLSREIFHKVYGLNHEFIAETYKHEAEAYLNLNRPNLVKQSLEKLYNAANYKPDDLAVINAPFVALEALQLDFKSRLETKEKYAIIDKQIDLINHIKNYYHTPEAKLFFNSTTSKIIQDAVAFCYDAFNTFKDEKYLKKAFHLVQLSTNSILAEELQTVEHFKGTKEQVILNQLAQKLRADRAETEQELYYEETEDSLNTKLIDSLIYRRVFLSRQLDKCLVSLKASQGNKSTALSIIPFKKLQDKIDKNTLVVSYFIGRKNLYAICVTKSHIEFIKLEDWNDIQQSIQDMRNVLVNRLESETVLKKLHTYLVAPISNITNKKLRFILQGELSRIPFEALINREGAYLILNNAVTYQPAVSLITADYSEKKSYKNRWSGFGLSNTKNQDIPSSLEELKTLSKKTKGDLFLNQSATSTNLFLEAKDSKILHLAIHSKVNLDNPLYSELLMYENEVTASEIYNQTINSEMVVLSACDTGYGSIQKGEGVMSFSRAFTYAGASSTVNSLWEVPDKETTELMTLFYKNLEKGLSKDEALQNAKIEYLSHSDDELLEHPYYWAGFVISGDASPLQNTIPFYYYLFAAVFIFAVFILYKRFTKKNT